MIAIPQAVFGVEMSDNANGICRDALLATLQVFPSLIALPGRSLIVLPLGSSLAVATARVRMTNASWQGLL